MHLTIDYGGSTVTQHESVPDLDALQAARRAGVVV